MKAWVENLKIGPWQVLTFTDKSLKYLKVDDKPVTEPFKFLIGHFLDRGYATRDYPACVRSDYLSGVYR